MSSRPTSLAVPEGDAAFEHAPRAVAASMLCDDQPIGACLRICDELYVGCDSVTAFELEVTKIHQDKMKESSGGETHEQPPLSDAEEAEWLGLFTSYPFVFVQSHDTGLFVDYVIHRDEPLCVRVSHACACIVVERGRCCGPFRRSVGLLWSACP